MRTPAIRFSVLNIRAMDILHHQLDNKQRPLNYKAYKKLLNHLWLLPLSMALGKMISWQSLGAIRRSGMRQRGFDSPQARRNSAYSTRNQILLRFSDNQHTRYKNGLAFSKKKRSYSEGNPLIGFIITHGCRTQTTFEYESQVTSDTYSPTPFFLITNSSSTIVTISIQHHNWQIHQSHTRIDLNFIESKIAPKRNGIVREHSIEDNINKDEYREDNMLKIKIVALHHIQRCNVDMKRTLWGAVYALGLTYVIKQVVACNDPNVRWYIFGDDDTFFFVDNLVKTLEKYDHNEWYYIGSNS
ncbi:hypothetical protein RND71_012249 [Anisodus tanguticus]|uniref:Fringe-like glycosyltransferase domain-containing protein n=1 Tax=Anisodus tanguticus TaxID=243964 RepID=A0AAE1SF47_9SOLA|nr:hypothetical protein RND71_012249 [Anisodus tanguticus]